VRVAPSLLVVALAGTVAPAVEGAEPVSLAWNAPAGCPTGDAVLGDVNAILGGPTSHHAAARADVTQLAPQHWSVHVTTDVDGAQGERTLEADSCQSLAKATALILAWTVDPIKARAAALAARASPPAPETTVPASPSSPIPLAAVVALSGMGDVGTLPSLGGGVELSLGALVGPLRFELSGDYWGPQDKSKLVNGDEVGAHIQLLEGSLRTCFRWRPSGRFELDPCAGAALVHASISGYGPTPTFTAAHGNTGDWAVLHADALVAWRLFGPFALRASVGAAVSPVTPPFIVTSSTPQGSSVTPLHQPSTVSGSATLGVEAHFP
jgi:hypothetical protein